MRANAFGSGFPGSGSCRAQHPPGSHLDVPGEQDPHPAPHFPRLGGSFGPPSPSLGSAIMAADPGDAKRSRRGKSQSSCCGIWELDKALPPPRGLMIDSS